MLPVYFGDRLVGNLQEERIGIRFTYAADWLAGANPFAISVTMPLQPEPYGEAVASPWFANLLPEDRQLEQIGRHFGRAPSDVYGLLAEIGRDTAGALSIGAPEPGDRGKYRELDEAAVAAAIARLPQRPLLAGEDGVTMSLAGLQSKLAVAVFDGRILLPLHGAASTHIMKPASDRLHATVENELLCLRLAARLNLPVAPATMAVAEGRRYLLVKRYDRRIDAPQQVTRSHQEDFCQALNLYPSEKYQARRGPGLAELYRVIGQYSRQPARDRLNLLDLVIFACCIGDTDRHGKNFSLILTDGGPKLAPGYDLMSALLYDGITQNLAMKIGDNSRAGHLQRRHWQRFAQSVGIAAGGTVNRVEQLAKQAADNAETVAMDLAGEFPADATALRQFAGEIQKQAQLIADNSRRGPPASAEDATDTS